MSDSVRIVHVVRWAFETPAEGGHVELRLVPRAADGVVVDEHQLTVRPRATTERCEPDASGNVVTTLEMGRPFTTLEVVNVVTGHVVAAEPAAPTASWELATAAAHDDGSGLCGAAPELASFACPSFRGGRPLDEALRSLMQRIHSAVRYDERADAAPCGALAVLARARGVCQDLAHLAVGCLRSLGVRARYVSGYLARPAVRRPHAWAAVALADGRWLDFDPTHGRIGAAPSVTLAWGRDYRDVAPASGTVIASGRCRLDSSVRVLRARTPNTIGASP